MPKKQYVLNETPAVKQALEKIEWAIQVMRKKRDRRACLEAKHNLERALDVLRLDPIFQLKFRREWRFNTTRRGIDYHILEAISCCDDAADGYYQHGKKEFRRSADLHIAIKYTKDIVTLMRKGSI